MNALSLPLPYKQISLAAALLCAALFAVMMLCPPLVHWLFGIVGNASADFMTRRASVLFLGLAAITFLTRNEPPSAARRSVAASLFITMAGLATLGMIELMRGAAGMGMMLAILAEAIFAGLYLPFALKREARES